MNKKLISLNILLSMLCMINIVFGMDNGPFSNGYTVQILTTTKTLGTYSSQCIDKDGKLTKSSTINGGLVPTHTGQLTPSSPEHLLSYTSLDGKATENHPIAIPTLMMQTILTEFTKKSSENKHFIIKNSDQTLRINLTQIKQSSYFWSGLFGSGLFLATAAVIWFYFFRR